MVYASTHLSLATLEVLVHVNNATFLDSRVAIRFEIDDALVMQLDDQALPVSWDALPAPVSSQKSGDAWAASGQSMGLLVPSAILPKGNKREERNLLLDPKYPDFIDTIRNVEIIPFSFDDRIAVLANVSRP
jgi:RES domain-containing protein